MASSSEAAQQPSAATRQSEFEQAVAFSLHLWPSLTLAVQNNWGGPDSADKRDWFAGAIVDLFSEFADAQDDANPAAAAAAKKKQQPQTVEEPDAHDVEEVLLQVMVDEFEVNVDDDSSLEVAENIIRAREQCAAGRFDEVKRLRERFHNLKGGGANSSGGSKVEQMFKKGEDQDQDTDWESDDSEESDDDNGGDVVMDEAPQLVAAPREKQAPEVDEDGFTKVTRKKR